MNKPIKKPVATTGPWALYLLGRDNEQIRKAYILNMLTKEQLDATVSISTSIDKKSTEYTVIECVDRKNGTLLEFTQRFLSNTR